MLQEQIEKAKQDFQSKMDRLISGGAGCLVMDEAGETVTELLLASFEVFRAAPIFDRKTGEIMDYNFWVFFQEFYFDAGMQYSHLFRMHDVEWLSDNNVKMTNEDDWVHYVSMFDPPEVDSRPHEILVDWRRYYQDNSLAEVAAELRAEYFRMMENMEEL